MNNNTLLDVVIFVFFIMPLVGLAFVIRDLWLSRIHGKELDKIANEFREKLDLLRRMDIACFDGSLSNWLEKKIRTTTIDWVKVSLRLVTQAKYVGLGERHRELLSQDEGYRNLTLRYYLQLADAYESGKPTQVFTALSRLFALFYNTDINRETTSLTSKDKIDEIITNVKAIDLSNGVSSKIGIIEIQTFITETLRDIGHENIIQDSGSAILILHWILIRLQDKRKQSGRIRFNKVNGIGKYPRELEQIKENYLRGNYKEIFNVMAERYR